MKIFNNSFGYDQLLRGTYGGITYNVQAPLFEVFWDNNGSGINYRLLANHVLNAARSEDAVWVWAAGNLGWHTNGHVRFCLRSDTNCTNRIDNAIVGSVTPAEFKKGFTLDSSPSNPQVNLANLPDSGTDFYAVLPAISGYESLEERWLAVVAVQPDGDSYRLRDTGTNGCGRAMNWCLAAPGTNIFTTTSDGGHRAGNNGTSFAAPYVSGALAVL